MKQYRRVWQVRKDDDSLECRGIPRTRERAESQERRSSVGRRICSWRAPICWWRFSRDAWKVKTELYSIRFWSVNLERLQPDNVRVIRAANPVCRRMTERCKVLNHEHNVFRDQPTSRACPLRIKTLLFRVPCHHGEMPTVGPTSNLGKGAKSGQQARVDSSAPRMSRMRSGSKTTK